MSEIRPLITPKMMVIDIIHQYRQTEQIFKGLEKEKGSCICCHGLFISLREAAKQFDFNMEHVLADLNDAIMDRKE